MFPRHAGFAMMVPTVATTLVPTTLVRTTTQVHPRVLQREAAGLWKSQVQQPVDPWRSRVHLLRSQESRSLHLLQRRQHRQCLHHLPRRQRRQCLHHLPRKRRHLPRRASLEWFIHVRTVSVYGDVFDCYQHRPWWHIDRWLANNGMKKICDNSLNTFYNEFRISRKHRFKIFNISIWYDSTDMIWLWLMTHDFQAVICCWAISIIDLSAKSLVINFYRHGLSSGILQVMFFV